MRLPELFHADGRKRRLGWLPDLPWIERIWFPHRLFLPRDMPASVQLDGKMPPVYDQGNLGSCVLNALNAVMEHTVVYDMFQDYMFSRLFDYYTTRVYEGSDPSQDTGCTISGAVAAVTAQGVCKESTWPYNVGQFAVKPYDAAYTEALKVKIKSALSVEQTLDAIKTCLAAGLPITFGIFVYASFPMDSTDGIVPDPDANEQMLGGHGIVLTGYDDATQRFTFRNSWGTTWGDQKNRPGCGYLSYNYVLNSEWASDFKIVQAIIDTLDPPGPTPDPEPPPAPPTPTPAPGPVPPTPTPAPPAPPNVEPSVWQEIWDWLVSVFGMPRGN